MNIEDQHLEIAVLSLTDTSPKSIVKAALQSVRKKPVVVSATKWYPEHDMAVSKDGCIDYSELIDGYANGYALIYTLEGVMRGNPGDWIIVGIKKERFFCADDVFQKTYDKE